MTPSHYKAYQSTVRQSMNALDATALLLEKAAQSMVQARLAIEEKKIERRFQESEKAFLILGNLEKSLVWTDDPAQAKIADNLKVYYNDTMTLIMRMNLKNDPKTAQALADSLMTVAQEFKKANALHEETAHQPYSSSEGFTLGA